MVDALPSAITRQRVFDDAEGERPKPSEAMLERFNMNGFLNWY
jgi:hypothetical protein